MKLELTDKEAVKVLLLVRHYLNTVLNGSRLPVRQSSVDFYEALYVKIGQQIEDQKEGAEDA